MKKLPESRVLKRYNQFLFNEILKIIEEISSGKTKLEFFQILKTKLERSGVLNRDLPVEVVPMKEVFIELYNELYHSSYLQILETKNERKIKKKEKRIVKHLKKSIT